MTQHVLCGEVKIAVVTKNPFVVFLNKDCVFEMNQVYNRLHWPILAAFIYQEKITGKNEFTAKDFNDMFINRGYVSIYLRNLSRGEHALVEEEDRPTAKPIYKLSTNGRKVVEIIWKYLSFLTKDKEEPLTAFVERMRKIRSLELPPEVKDVEEEEIEQIKETNRLIEIKNEALKAGIPQYPKPPQEQGPIKINLENVEVK